MQATFLCQNCHTERPANPRLKGKQSYCSLAVCQRARKSRWHRQAMATDKDYRAQQLDCMQTWRKKRPLHRYQKEYRQKHPDYVENNRQKQHLRNRRRRQPAPAKVADLIVKMDALTGDQSEAYVMTPFIFDAGGKIVKMDALFVQLQRFQKDVHGHFAGAA